MNGKTLEYLSRIVIILLTGAIMWASSTIITMRETIAVMQGNRFTSQDGLRMEARIRADMLPAEWTVRVIDLENCMDRHLQDRPCR